MNILIIYASKNGVSKNAAERLASELSSSHSVEVYSIDDSPPSPNDFDVVVLGGSVRMTRLNKKLKKYLKEHIEIISNMPSAFFFCCGIIRDWKDYKATELPSRIRFSLGVECFGGELKPDKLKGIDKLIVKAMRQKILTQDPDLANSSGLELPEFMPENILALAERIRRLPK
ncbi:MAG: hypothetical protein J6U68_01200 [Clostridia bacterium]|nr:hypothetical protein [Clostridia bacterium]